MGGRSAPSRQFSCLQDGGPVACLGGCALRSRQCIHFACQSRIPSGRNPGGSGAFITRQWKVHASSEDPMGNEQRSRRAQASERCGALGQEGPNRERLAQRNTTCWYTGAPKRRATHGDPSTNGSGNTSGEAEDSAVCGKICYEAFAALSAKHGFPADFPSVEVSTGVMASLFSAPGFYCVVAESGGRIVGSNCADERAMIAGIGPITIDPGAQNAGRGKEVDAGGDGAGAGRNVRRG